MYRSRPHIEKLRSNEPVRKGLGSSIVTILTLHRWHSSAYTDPSGAVTRRQASVHAVGSASCYYDERSNVRMGIDQTRDLLAYSRSSPRGGAVNSERHLFMVVRSARRQHMDWDRESAVLLDEIGRASCRERVSVPV